MIVLGISAFYHDSAAALVEDGSIVAAAQEERFTRKKHDPRFPVNAIGYCLEKPASRSTDVDHVAFYDKPFLKFERLARDLSGLCAARLRVIPHGDAALDRREAVPEGHAAASELQSHRRQTRCGREASCSPSITSAMRRPPSFRRRSRKRRSDHGRRRRMGDDFRGASAAATSLSIDEGNPLPAFARPACIPPSPTTPASRSIPANTR